MMIGSLVIYMVFMLFTSATLLETRFDAHFGELFNTGQHYRYNCPSDLSQQRCNEFVIRYYMTAMNLVINCPESVPVDVPDIYVGMLNDLGLVLMNYGTTEYVYMACNVFEEGLSISPHHRPILSNYASLLVSLGHYSEGASLYSLATSGEDVPALLLYNYGNFEFNHGSKEKAVELWERVLRQDPTNYYAVSSLATYHCTQGDTDRTLQLYAGGLAAFDQNQGAAVEPGPFYWVFVLQNVINVIPMITSSPGHINHIRRTFADNVLGLMGVAPLDSIDAPWKYLGCSSLGYYMIYHGFEDLYLRRLLATLYQHISFSLLVAPRSELQSMVPDHPVEGACAEGVRGCQLQVYQVKVAPRLKIGFLSAFFFHHSVSVLLKGVIKNLDRRLFDVYVIYFGQQGFDHVSDAFDELPNATSVYIPKRHVVAVEYTTDQFEAMRRTVAGLKLDVLVYGEIGMDDLTYFLAFGRVARRSVVFWGHAVSSGISSFAPDEVSASGLKHVGGPDYFVSSELFETPLSDVAGPASPLNPQQQYSERLLLQRGMTTFFEHPPRALSVEEFGTMVASAEQSSPFCLGPRESSKRIDYRESPAVHLPNKVDYVLFLLNHEPSAALFEGLPRWRSGCGSGNTVSDSSLHFYGLLQTLYKLHPDNDALIAVVLARDPKAFVLMPQGINLDYVEQVRQRWRLDDALRPHMDRVLFLRSMNEREYLTLAAVVDVMLDPFPVGGGRSSFEILSTGTPIVLLKPRTSILQLTFAMYRTMGIGEECVCNSLEEYVDAAVRLGGDVDGANTRLRDGILRYNSRLYGNYSVIQEWQDMLLYIAAAPRPVPHPDRALGEYCRTRGTCSDTTSGFNEPASGNWRQGEWSPHSTYPDLLPIVLRDVSVYALLDTGRARVVVNSTHIQSELVPASAVATTAVDAAGGAIVYGLRFHDPFLLPLSSPELEASDPLKILDELGVDWRVPGHDVIEATVYPDGTTDWQEQCLQATVHTPQYRSMTGLLRGRGLGDHDTRPVQQKYYQDVLKMVYVCNLISKAVIRVHAPAARLAEIEIGDNDTVWGLYEAAQRVKGEGVHAPTPLELNCSLNSASFGCHLGLVLRVGDDLAQQLCYLKYKYVLWDNFVLDLSEATQSLFPTELMGSPAWVEIRRAQASQWLCWLTEPMPRESGNIPRYLLNMHSEHHLALHSFLDELAPYRGSVCTGHETTLRVLKSGSESSTDQSSDTPTAGGYDRSDISLVITTSRRLAHFRRTMAALVAAAEEYRTESPIDKEGAGLFALFRDVVIIDDGSSDEDREAMRRDFGAYRLVFKPLGQEGHARSLNMAIAEVRTRFLVYLEDDWELLPATIIKESPAVQSASADLLSSSLSGPRLVFPRLVHMAKTILKQQRNSSLAQILFNEQSDRACSLGEVNTHSCGGAMDGGGWVREVKVHRVQDRKVLSLPFQLHEFSLLPNFERRDQRFGYWPGLSLNPGIWDLHRIRTQLSSHALKQPRDREDGLVNSDELQVELPVPLFNEDSALFEQQFSLMTWFTGLQMGFLPAVIFQHIGDVSSYVLNNVTKRPWDIPY